MCEKCREDAMNATGVVAKEVERVSDRIEELMNEDAKALYEQGKAAHPFIHAEALVENAGALISMPLMAGLENGDQKEVERVLEQGLVFKESVMKALAVAGTTQDMPTMAGIIGMLDAVKELLEGFHVEIEREDNDGVTPSEETTSVDELLKGILFNND